MIGVLGLAKVSPAEKQTPAEPAEPKPSPTVQKLLDEATTGVAAKWNAEALALAERALVAAHAENDGAGEAQAQRLRAQVLSAMNRRQEALSAWEAAAATWARLGDGPGRGAGRDGCAARPRTAGQGCSLTGSGPRPWKIGIAAPPGCRAGLTNGWANLL